MAGFLDEFRRKVLAPLHKEEEMEPKEIDDKIALGKNRPLPIHQRGK
jgi:hypothetical protein